jgi:hypothetical protein
MVAADAVDGAPLGDELYRLFPFDPNLGCWNRFSLSELLLVLLTPLDVVASKIDEPSLAITIPSPKCLLGMCRIELKNSLSTSVIRNVTKEDVSSVPTEGFVVISFFFPPIDAGVIGVAVVVVVAAIVLLEDEVEGTTM